MPLEAPVMKTRCAVIVRNAPSRRVAGGRHAGRHLTRRADGHAYFFSALALATRMSITCVTSASSCASVVADLLPSSDMVGEVRKRPSMAIIGHESTL